jgi:tripartite-type tricarboxylate transporter receptor subunit TctC
MRAGTKSKPGEFNYASRGIGSVPHLLGEILKKAGGVDIAPIHYKGTPEALSGVLGGRVPSSGMIRERVA